MGVIGQRFWRNPNQMAIGSMVCVGVVHILHGHVCGVDVEIKTVEILSIMGGVVLGFVNVGKNLKTFIKIWVIVLLVNL